MRAVRRRDNMTVMTLAPDRPSIEPLFAYNERLWLRVWAATQAVALAVACYVMSDAAGGIRPFLASPSAVRALITVAMLVAYHVIGFRGYRWMMRRAWAVFVFVPLGWAIILASFSTNGAFSVLILGAILQGFIFLPFAWAIATLVAVMLLMTSAIVMRRMAVETSLTISRVVGLLATGTMFGTVMHYNPRANRDWAIRSRLLRELDEAQRGLAARAHEAGAQEERQRLARDIHDTLAQGFTSVIKHLEAIELSFAAPRVDSADVIRGALPHLSNAQAVSRASLDEIRRLVWALRPPQLVETTLAAAIERIVAQWSEANGIAATCAITALPRMQPDAEVIFLRATQESLSNVARHAHATHVSVAMHCVDELLLLSVEDDGRGFTDADVAGAGKMGLMGMRERVRPFGGRVLIESANGTGASITVALPLAFVTAPP
jgi:signal transduction histidine kinase